MMRCGSSLRGLSLVTITSVGEPRRDASHQRTLAAVALAAAAEDAHERAIGDWRSAIGAVMTSRSVRSTFSSASGVCA